MSRTTISLGLLLLPGLWLAGCGSSSVPCSTDNDCVATGQAACSQTTSTCVDGPSSAGLIGSGDPALVALAVVFEPDRPRQPTGLGFNPEKPNELWIVNYTDSTVITVTDPGTATATSVRRRDPGHGHFMVQPTGIAMGGLQNSWATCGDHDGTPYGQPDFAGPAVFSADSTIFTVNTAGGLGSHLDMLHNTNFCMGIAHERDNVYWVFDGGKGSLSRYDFAEFHEPGADDHSDGTIRHYAPGQVTRVAGVPSQLVFNADDAHLYAIDTGGKRIVKLDTKSGTLGAELPALEPTIPVMMDGAVLTEVVAPGTLELPTGLALKDSVLYVSDKATSRISAFDLTGRLLRSFDTGLAAGSLGGLTVGPDAKLYFVDALSGRAFRIDP